jgi:hypothetical protein
MQPKKYTIALETDPSQRWIPIIQDHLKQIKSIYRELQEQNSGAMATILSGLISASSLLGKVLYKEEIQSIAKLCEIPFGQSVMLQCMY